MIFRICDWIFGYNEKEQQELWEEYILASKKEKRHYLITRHLFFHKIYKIKVHDTR